MRKGMRTDVYVIEAHKAGVLQGYVSSVSYKTGKCAITKDLANAKAYKVIERAFDDIDAIIFYAQEQDLGLLIV